MTWYSTARPAEPQASPIIGAIRWLRQRSDLATTALIVLVATAGLFTPSTSAALVGLSLSVTMGMYGLFNWGLSVKAMLDSKFPNVERIRQFVAIAPERYVEGTLPPPDGWPQSGEVVFDHVSMRYSEDGPTVLDDLSFSIRSGERIGIVGYLHRSCFCVWSHFSVRHGSCQAHWGRQIEPD